MIGRNLTTRFVETEIDFLGSPIKVWKLKDFCFNSANILPPCASPNHHCRSGKYTLLLDVEDTVGNHYYDTQHVWFDNKPIHAEFGGIEGLPRCSDLNFKRSSVLYLSSLSGKFCLKSRSGLGQISFHTSNSLL